MYKADWNGKLIPSPVDPERPDCTDSCFSEPCDHTATPQRRSS